MQLDEPLSDKEFDELDQFLLSERCPDDAMTMDALHGYLTAIAIGPEEIMLAEWLPHVWGEGRQTPKFNNEKQYERIVSLIVRFLNEIVITLEVAPKEFEPLFCTQNIDGETLIDGEAWAFGFYEGLELRLDAWSAIWQSSHAALMRPFYLLGADEIDESEVELADDEKKRHKLSIEMEANILEIQRFWLPLRKSTVATVRHETPPPGRNGECPCGSGKKFKKCCGAGPTIH